MPTPYLLVESLYEKVSFELQYSFLYEFEILQYLSVCIIITRDKQPTIFYLIGIDKLLGLIKGILITRNSFEFNIVYCYLFSIFYIGSIPVIAIMQCTSIITHPVFELYGFICSNGKGIRDFDNIDF